MARNAETSIQVFSRVPNSLVTHDEKYLTFKDELSTTCGQQEYDINIGKGPSGVMDLDNVKDQSTIYFRTCFSTRGGARSTGNPDDEKLHDTWRVKHCGIEHALPISSCVPEQKFAPVRIQNKLNPELYV